jgi:hypothetical protein
MQSILSDEPADPHHSTFTQKKTYTKEEKLIPSKSEKKLTNQVTSQGTISQSHYSSLQTGIVQQKGKKH